ncbi:ATP-dependent helicase (plasmid) [Aliivibrio salmonicida]|uniref:ATP-dependent helicase n=1 Tax=Aliivibrio salmonicida TaxID=40269 RepID=UPI000F71B2B5|nr:ATP-dependent helicase [Aliivibrio salmonicida]AZL83440.1 ATP-dependent helicase [Aliivibrio salmonicida]
MSLTGPQRGVIESERNGNAMGIALPGSGKSHVVVSYIENVVLCQREPKVLAISFTKKAAEELRERVTECLGEILTNEHVIISTFDGIFRKQLLLAINQKTVNLLVGGDRTNVIMRAMRVVGVKLKYSDAELIIDRLSSYIEIPAEETEKHPTDVELYLKYEEYRKQSKKMDFSSICRAVVGGQERKLIPLMDFTHIIVDEFQDSSELQYRWMKPYASKDVKMLVMGDDDQSIYSFRRAKGYENFLNFQHDFNSGPPHILNTCFRCKPVILAAADKLIQNNKERVQKVMRSVHDTGGMVLTKSSFTKGAEVISIVNEIEKSENHGAWAVLSRRNFDLLLVAAELTERGIEFNMKDGASIFETAAADMLYKLASTILNKNKVHIEQILAFQGVSDTDIEKAKRDGGLSRGMSLQNYRLPNGVDHIQANVTQNLFMSIKEWIILAESDRAGSDKTATYNGIWEALTKRSKIPKSVGNVLSSLIGMINKSELSFRDSLKLYSAMFKNLQKSSKSKVNSDGVNLLTMHSSKGLQFVNVWVMNVTDGVCPPLMPSFEEKEEERRLLFVAMTRAMENLVISYIESPITEQDKDKALEQGFSLSDFKEKYVRSPYIYELEC